MTLLYNIFSFYSSYLHKLNSFNKKIYKEFIKKVLLRVPYIFINYFLSIEPLHGDWISISSIDTKNLNYKENVISFFYKFFTKKKELVSLKEDYFYKNASGHFDDLIENYSNTYTEDYLVIYKISHDKNTDEEIYKTYQIKNNNFMNIINMMLPKYVYNKTNVNILDVLYISNQPLFVGETPIVPSLQVCLDIPKSYLMVGNKILSNIFILRMLKYKKMEKYFSSNYSVKIIYLVNEKIKNIELLSTQYIKISKNNLEICFL